MGILLGGRQKAFWKDGDPSRRSSEGLLKGLWEALQKAFKNAFEKAFIVSFWKDGILQEGLTQSLLDGWHPSGRPSEGLLEGRILLEGLPKAFWKDGILPEGLPHAFWKDEILLEAF